MALEGVLARADALAAQFALVLVRDFVPVVLLVCASALVERRVTPKPGWSWRAWRFNLAWHAFYLAIAFALAPLLWGGLVPGLPSVTPGAPGCAAVACDLPFWLRCLGAVLVADLLAYWAHRWQHRSAWLWSFHRFHHDEAHINASTSLRVHWLHIPYAHLTLVVPVTGLFGLDVLGVVYWVLMAASLVSHMDVRWRLGLLGRLVVTAPYHRLHHAVDPALHGRNLATLLPVWDTLFGTRAQPHPGATPACGLDEHAPTASLVDALVQPWLFTGRRPGKRVG